MLSFLFLIFYTVLPYFRASTLNSFLKNYLKKPYIMASTNKDRKIDRKYLSGNDKGALAKSKLGESRI